MFAGDLTDPSVPDALVKKAQDEFGSVDILVNNAGYTWDGVAHKMTDEQFQAMLDIHTVAPFRLIRAIAPAWREAAKAEKAENKEVFRKVMNISSISGTMGNAGQINYSAGKSAIVGMTKTLAKEWGAHKINVNAVASRLRRDAPDAGQGEGRDDREGRRVDRDRRPRADARDGRNDHPARASRAARGGGRTRPVPLLAARQLRPWPGPERDRRPVRGHVHLTRRTPGWAPQSRGAQSRGLRSSAGIVSSPVRSVRLGGGHGPNQSSRAPSIVIVVPEKKSPAGDAR